MWLEQLKQRMLSTQKIIVSKQLAEAMLQGAIPEKGYACEGYS
jgi:hypothetical protein